MGIATLGTTKTGGGISGIGKSKVATKKATDLTSLEGLRLAGEQAGYGKEVSKILDQKPKLSILQRLSKGLSAFNPAEAILTGVEEESPIAGIAKYGTGIAKGLGSALTGRDYEGERRYFSDVAEKLGVENGIAKFGIGFVGDVLLDPTTYFGGAIARGIGATAKVGSKIALKGVAKVAPETAVGLKMVGEGLQDALGRAFQYGYKSSKGATDDVLKFLSKEQTAKLELASSNLNRLGTGTLSKGQQEELALKMIAGKRAEFAAREAGKSSEEIAQLARQAATSTDPVVKKTIEEQIARSKKFAEGVTDNPYETYFPFIKKDKLTMFLNETKGIKVGSEGYRKQFRNLMTNEAMELDPAKAFFTRESQITTDKMTREFLKGFVSKYGKSFANEAEAKVAGFVPVYEKGLDSGLGFYKGVFNPAEDILKQIELQGFRGTIVKPQTLEQSFTKVGRAIQIAEESGLKVSKLMRARTAGGKATLGGIEKSGSVRIKAFTSDVISHELGHSFDVSLSKVINTKRIYQQELGKVVEFTKLGGSQSYRNSAVERFAEFTDLYIHNPGKAKELAPTFAGYFENELLPNQKIGDLVSKLSDFYKKVDSLPNIKSPLKELDSGNYLETTIRKAFPKKEYIGVTKNTPLGFIGEFDAKLIRDSISPEFQTINMLAKATGFDAVTSLFKRSVTGLFAPFHVRNYMSGLIQNYEVLGAAAFNPKNIAVGQKIAYLMGKGEMPSGTIELAGKTFKFKDIMKQFVDRFSGDTFYNNDFMMAIDKGVELKQVAKIFGKQRIKETIKTVGLGQEAIPFKIARGIGQFIEHQQKATAYITGLSQGKTVQEALKLAEKAGFDYRALTRFESQIMRRIIPFYSFTRKNIELQLRTLGENPQRINQVLRFFGSMGDSISEEEKLALPDFIKESIGIKLEDTPEGLKQYVSSFGTPIEAFTQLFGSNPILRAISTMNPILKVPIEIGIGKDSFRQRDLKDVYNANEYKLAPQIIKDLLDIKEVPKDILKKNEKTGKLDKTGERMTYVADPVRLLIARSLFTSRGVSYLDQVFSNDLKGFIKVLKTTTGVKPQQVDIEQQKYFKEKEQKREIEDLLIRTGEVRKFERIYTPKD